MHSGMIVSEFPLESVPASLELWFYSPLTVAAPCSVQIRGYGFARSLCHSSVCPSVLTLVAMVTGLWWRTELSINQGCCDRHENDTLILYQGQQSSGQTGKTNHQPCTHHTVTQNN